MNSKSNLDTALDFLLDDSIVKSCQIVLFNKHPESDHYDIIPLIGISGIYEGNHIRVSLSSEGQGIAILEVFPKKDLLDFEYICKGSPEISRLLYLNFSSSKYYDQSKVDQIRDILDDPKMNEEVEDNNKDNKL